MEISKELAKATNQVKDKERNAIELSTTSANQVKHNLKQLKDIAKVIKDGLKDGIDYGLIPGTGNKPSLFKSGADTLCLLFGFRQVYKILLKEIDTTGRKPFIKYQFQCNLINNQNIIMAEGFGLCSSQEKSRETDNPFHFENTIMKMAKKRALVDAVISLGILSQVFTQDVEDLPLATTNAEAQLLRKFDILALYTFAYDHFAELKPEFIPPKAAKGKKVLTQKDMHKEFIKDFIKIKWLKTVGINKASFQYFTPADKKKLIEYSNQIENKEKDLHEAREYKKNWNGNI